jgi:hypothetical protein
VVLCVMVSGLQRPWVHTSGWEKLMVWRYAPLFV